MGWPYYVRNPKKELCFNYLLLGRDADDKYIRFAIGSKNFLCCYPTMHMKCGVKIGKRSFFNSKMVSDRKVYLSHNGSLKSYLDIRQKADTDTSSHCAMIRVSPLPLYDESSNFSSLHIDLVIHWHSKGDIRF